jgi:hypothetical protein
VSHSNVRLLNNNDFLFDSWNESDISQCVTWDDTKTVFFWTTTWFKRLDHEVIAVVLMNQCVYHDIGLFRMIVNL